MYVSVFQMCAMSIPTPQLLLTATQLGHLLRAARKQHGLTQAHVGARLGLSQNRVSHLEHHADEISVRQLLAWSAVVGLELTVHERGSAGPHAVTATSDPALAW